jgi:hypothetical protein
MRPIFRRIVAIPQVKDIVTGFGYQKARSETAQAGGALAIGPPRWVHGGTGVGYRWDS